MVTDNRGSRKPRSGVVTLSSGSNSPTSIVSLRDEEAMSVEEIRMQYDSAGTTAAVVEIYDEPEGTSAGDLSDKVDEFRLTSGDSPNPDMEWEDIEDDVILYADGNSDAEITVTIGGFTISG